MRENLENLEKTDSDIASDAASLMKINVRKSKQEKIIEAPKHKSGDITERLAALAKELDGAADTVHPNNELPLIVKPQPQKSGWDSSQPDRRGAHRKAPQPSGWKQRNTPPDILSYWMDIRGGQRRYPSWQSLEPEVIGKHWPNCILVHCNREAGRLQVKYDFTQAVRKVLQTETPDEELLNRIEFTPMIIDWILGIGREVAASRKPAHSTEHFPSVIGDFPLRVIALPLSDNGRDIDHVLCYIQKLQ